MVKTATPIEVWVLRVDLTRIVYTSFTQYVFF